jgi:UV DNA damage endonuclease
MEPPKINLGLCCINTILRKQNIFNSRTCIRRLYSVEKAQKLSLLNVKDLVPMMDFNNKNNINCFRLSSDMFPHFTDEKVEKYDIEFARDDLQKAGKVSSKYGQRILMHPGQYNQVGAKERSIFERTIEDLKHHANILDEMGVDNNGVLIVHGGGTYNNKQETIKRWISQFYELPEKVRNRLVIENCERQYSVDDCLYISSQCHIPVVFDVHHYKCMNILKPETKQRALEELMPDIIKTWGDRRPVMHISQSRTDKKNICAHSDYITEIDDIFFWVRDKLGVGFDLEVEAKMKEQAIFKVREKYANKI